MNVTNECLVGTKDMVTGLLALSGLAQDTLEASPSVSLIAVRSNFLR